MQGRVTTKHTIDIKVKTTHSNINGLWATWLRYLLTQEKEQLEKRGFKHQNDMHDSNLYLLLLKLQLTICYVTCVKPEFRSWLNMM